MSKLDRRLSMAANETSDLPSWVRYCIIAGAVLFIAVSCAATMMMQFGWQP